MQTLSTNATRVHATRIACFIVNKTALLHNLIQDFNIDMLAVTETWVYENSSDVHKEEAAPEGFNIIHTHRAPKIGTGSAHGGGVALIYQDTIEVKVIPSTAAVTLLNYC